MAKTRKVKNHKKSEVTLTIPQLRKSLQHMDSYSEKLLSTKPVGTAAVLFASEWKHVFGKSLSPKDAEAYMKNKMKNRKYKKTRKHRGGAILTGAPLDHITRAGNYEHIPEASYPPLVSKGFWNPEPAILQDSETQQGVVPYPNTGSNKAMAGGGILSNLTAPFAAAAFRPFVGENPISSGGYFQASLKGLPTGPGPNSYDNPNLRM
jgi:hypothetical protein